MKSAIYMGMLLLAGVPSTQQQELPPAPQAQQSIPDSPRPNVLPDAETITPGKGATSTSDTLAEPDPDAPGASLPNRTSTVPVEPADTVAPDVTPDLGQGGRVKELTLRTTVDFVEVPFTVKDRKGALVPGLTWRDVQVYENGVRQHLNLFTVDPYPLSVAFVLDQSLPFQTMKTVNTALGAVQGAFTPYDEMAVFTYSNGTRMRTDYSRADGARIGAVLEQSKTEGREMVYVSTGPLSQNVNLNNGAMANTMPNVNSTHGSSLPGSIGNLPKEQHPLNDAIFEAAKSLTKSAKGRRRIIYVVSDGKEAGSTVKSKELIRFLQTNNIAVYATIVGDSATPYVGFLDKFHIPLTMRENVLPHYCSVTGGQAISEFRMRGIETSFQKIAEQVRVQYTAGYYSHEPFADGKYRPIEVRVLKPDLAVIAKPGYYPTPEAMRSTTAR